MENHTYFAYQMDIAGDKTAMLETLKRQILDTLDHGPVPAAMHAAVDFLLFLSSYNNPGHVQLSEVYSEVSMRLTMQLYFLHTAVANPELTWPACCATCGETHPDDELPDDPDDDADGNDDDEEIFAVLQELYGPKTDVPAHTGTRRPYPDYEHWANWTETEWINFGRYQKKVLAASTCEFSTMSLAISSLAAIKANMGTLPLERQVEVSIWASDVVDQLTTGLESQLHDLCRYSLYTKEGRAIQRQLLSASQGSATD